MGHYKKIKRKPKNKEKIAILIASNLLLIAILYGLKEIDSPYIAVDEMIAVYMIGVCFALLIQIVKRLIETIRNITE